jgi:hypothetical protein
MIKGSIHQEDTKTIKIVANMSALIKVMLTGVGREKQTA